MRWMLILACVLMLLATERAGAVIAVKATMRDVYLGSDLILIGRAARVDKERSAVEVEVVEVLKGQVVEVFKQQPEAGKVLVQFVNQPALFERVKEGQSIVVMNARGQQRHSVHAGDLWTVAERHEGARVPKWNVVADNADMQKTFPGGTASLAEALRLQKRGKLKMEVKWDDGRLFPAGWTKVGVLKVAGAQSIVPVDANGDGVMEMIVEKANESRIFTKEGDTFRDITEAMKFSRKHPPGEALFQAEVDVTGDGQMELVTLSKTGKLEVRAVENGEYGKPRVMQLWQKGEADAAMTGDFAERGAAGLIVARDGGLFRYSFDEQDHGEADFTRLTGEKLATYHPADGGRMKNVKLVDPDLNGDGRVDLVVIAENGMFAMLNRGHGAFFASTVAVKVLAEGGPKRTNAAWGSGPAREDGIQGLLMLAEDGVLYEAPALKP